MCSLLPELWCGFRGSCLGGLVCFTLAIENCESFVDCVESLPNHWPFKKKLYKMFPVVARTAASRVLAPQVSSQLAQRTVVSGPPKVRISLGEKIAHGLVMTASYVAIPTYIAANVHHYRN